MEHKMKVYRFLVEGEVLQAGDEWCEVYNGDGVWRPVKWCIGDALSACNGDTFRRPVTRVTDELTALRAENARLRTELAAVLDVCIERGGTLGYSDEDYQERLDELGDETP